MMRVVTSNYMSNEEGVIMNPVLEKRLIKELDCSPNFSYIVMDKDITVTSAYKFLQSQTDNFVKCMQMRYNGDIQLFYITKSLKSLNAMVRSRIDPESFMAIVANLLNCMVNVRHIGFMPSRNIDISFDRIYVDPSTYKVKLVYLPLSVQLYEDELHMDNEIRSGLLRMITTNPDLRSPRTAEFAGDLRNGMLSLEELYARVKGAKIQPNSHKTVIKGDHGDEKPRPQVKRSLRLVAVNAPNRVEIDVTKDHFVLGRNTAADGIISFNTKIGRMHCSIDRQNERYAVTDMNSKNHTYLNGTELEPGRPYPLKNGDKLRLANSDFQIIIQ